MEVEKSNTENPETGKSENGNVENADLENGDILAASLRIGTVSDPDLHLWIANKLEPFSSLRRLTEEDFDTYMADTLIRSALGAWEAIFAYENSDRGKWVHRKPTTESLISDLEHATIVLRKSILPVRLPNIRIRVVCGEYEICLIGDDLARLAAEAWALENGWR